MSIESRNEILDEKLQALLDAHDELVEFARSHPGEITSIVRGVEMSRIALEVTAPPEWQCLADAYDRARTEYETAVRKDERERIKTIIGGNEK